MDMSFSSSSRGFSTFSPGSTSHLQFSLLNCLTMNFTWNGKPQAGGCVNFFLPSPTRRQWHPTPVLLPGKSRGQRSHMKSDPGHPPRENVRPQDKLYVSPRGAYGPTSQNQDICISLWRREQKMRKKQPTRKNQL